MPFNSRASCSCVRLVARPSSISVAAWPDSVRLPPVSMTPGRVFSASYALSAVALPGMRPTS